jgi:hypothetical protein
LSRIINNSGVAVRQAVQVHQQHHQVVQQNMQMQQRRRSMILNPPPAPPEGQTVEYDVTSLGLEVRKSYTIKEAVIGGGFHQFEVIDSDGKAYCVGGGDRDDALLQIAIWISDGEDPGEVAPEDRPDFS